MPQEKDWAVLHVLAIEDACNAEAVAILTFLFSSVTCDDREAIDSLTHRGPVTHYCGGSILCKNPIFFTMKEFPQI